MAVRKSSGVVYQIGDYGVDPSRRTIEHFEVLYRLEPKSATAWRVLLEDDELGTFELVPDALGDDGWRVEGSKELQRLGRIWITACVRAGLPPVLAPSGT